MNARGLGTLVLVGAAAASAGAADVKRQIDALVDRPAFAAATWGIEVRSLKSGKVIYARNQLKNLKPASTLKLVTSAVALDVLGPDERLRTTVETAGRLDGMGRILGDVYLIGRGDPTLSGRFNGGQATAAFEQMADALRAAGIRRIEGRLVGHEGLFRGERRGEDWTWGDLVWSYGAEVSALSFNDNSVELRASPAERAGEPLVVEASPLSSYYRVVSTATTSAAGTAPTLVLARDLGTNVIRLSGAYPLGTAGWDGRVALEDPARYATTVFSEVLATRGIRVTGAVVTSSDPLPAGLRALATHTSPPVAELLKAVNKPSLNLHAEIMLRLLGARRRGEGSVEAGRAVVRETLARWGVGAQGWSLQDGSGLSHTDVLSAHELVSLLVVMDKHPHAHAFRETLPVAGVDGTLAGRMRGTQAEGRVAAKTGTLRYANALAGYATTKRGERLAFAVLANHHTGGSQEVVSAIDRIVAILAGS
jgi:D-alanyl-D-alanine carboxypeptidase/D-alanyl-D-alanine-endopeptidase (penicillin-binding protein 4)